MNVQNYQNYNISMQGKGSNFGKIKRFTTEAKQTVLDLFKERDIEENNASKIESLGGKLARPDINRAIMGVTALGLQPAIDYYNHRVDEETRTVSRNRTIAKIIVGTLVGIAVRFSSCLAIDKLTNPESKSKIGKLLIPKGEGDAAKTIIKKLSNYKNVLSTFLALAAMCITNFKIDAPLTAHLTNKLNAKSELKRKEGEGLYA